MNLLCGVLGVTFVFSGRTDIAFPLMLAAAVFDFLDGMSARALNAYSAIGKEWRTSILKPESSAMFL